MAHIQLQELKKQFGDFSAVHSSTFDVLDGEFFVMLGPSGCGKTTTLRMIAGLERPTGGNILIDQRNVTYLSASQRDIGFVFQLFALYPHMNVSQNLCFPLICQNVSKHEAKKRLDETLKLLRIEHLRNSPVSGLSGGDRQRVALGRAIIRKAKAFLMDEPLGSMDSEFRHWMCLDLKALHQRIHATTVYVTHDQIEAMSLADRIAVMNHGVVDQIDSPQQIYEYPKTLHVASFIGEPPMNLIEFETNLKKGQDKIRKYEADVDIPQITDDYPHGRYVLGIRPEHIDIVPDSLPGQWRGEVISVEYFGSFLIIGVRTHGDIIKVRLKVRQNSMNIQAGTNISLAPNRNRITIFDKNSGMAIANSLMGNK